MIRNTIILAAYMQLPQTVQYCCMYSKTGNEKRELYTYEKCALGGGSICVIISARLTGAALTFIDGIS